jgi:hypothetical protein
VVPVVVVPTVVVVPVVVVPTVAASAVVLLVPVAVLSAAVRAAVSVVGDLAGDRRSPGCPRSSTRPGCVPVNAGAGWP